MKYIFIYYSTLFIAQSLQDLFLAGERKSRRENSMEVIITAVLSREFNRLLKKKKKSNPNETDSVEGYIKGR